METKYWNGVVGEFDDFNKPIVDIFIDGRTRMGSWAIMTPASFREYGVGLGTGKGQKYVRLQNGRWAKMEG